MEALKVDRISDLPEIVLQHILSFLPTKQVVQSTLLSTTWKHMWSTFPILRFDQTYLEEKFWRSENENSPEIQRKIEELYNFVDKTLLSHQWQKLCINNFSLADCLLEQESVSRVHHWISFVVESNVQELNLDFKWGHLRYRLPHSVMVAKSLTVLTLQRCDLESTCGDINLPSLKELSLFDVNADDQIIQNLVAACPVIECMIILYCDGFQSLKLSNVPKLMALKVDENDDLERLDLDLDSNLSLYYLSIDQRLQSKLNLLPYKNLKDLTLCALNITNKWLHDHLSGLPLLETLRLYRCLEWERIEISSHHLKILMLHDCKNLVEVKIDTPKLYRFSYGGGYIKSFSTNALDLNDAIYNLVRDIAFSAPSDVEKIEFLSKLSNSKSLELKIDSTKNVIIPKELRETLPSPSYNVKFLRLTIFLSIVGHDINELLDTLLWISPLPDILLMECRNVSEPNRYLIFLKLSYEKSNYKRENPGCCKFLPFLCWRHCLKSVKIHSLNESLDDRENLHKYFSENAKTLEDFQFHVGGIA